MSKRKMIALIAALVCCLLLAGVALANETSAIDWDVMGGGGGYAESSDGVYILDGTIGQAVAGIVADTGYELCSGFWCGVGVEHNIYLPLVLRNSS